ncbi:bacteriohemerythrin [Geothrix paludis]|uniref:bacteriohemerythrin n=1 Tax=Geothrix paludis TaxID=2922722 RepID=UPI001FAC16DD|nr:hemerythrin family protein [Geothrix paludis]
MNRILVSALAWGFPMLWYSLRVNPAPAPRSAKSPACWRPQLETGLGTIDQQHRELFEALARLAGDLEAGASGALLDEPLAALARHLIKHCQTEESLMKEAGFPGRVAHANQHQEVVLQVRDLQYRRMKGQAVGREALADLGAWLEQHIGEADQAMAGYLKALHPV